MCPEFDVNNYVIHILGDVNVTQDGGKIIFSVPENVVPEVTACINSSFVSDSEMVYISVKRDNDGTVNNLVSKTPKQFYSGGFANQKKIEIRPLS
jgi:hypothetical protein